MFVMVSFEVPVMSLGHKTSYILEIYPWVYFVFVPSLSCVCLSASPWTAACQASLSFTRKPKNGYLDTLNFPFEDRVIAPFPTQLRELETWVLLVYRFILIVPFLQTALNMNDFGHI